MDERTIEHTFKQAIQHHRAGQLGEAEKLYRQVLAQQPQHVDAMHNLGAIDLEFGRFHEAADRFRQAVTQRPKFVQAWYNLSVALCATGRFEEAAAAARQAISLSPNYPPAHAALGMALTGQQMFEEAVTEFRLVIAANPRLPDVQHRLGDALRRQGRFEEAIVALQDAIAQRPDHADALNHLGIALREVGRFDKAIEVHRRVLAQFPDSIDAHFNLGRIQLELGMLDEAIAAFRKSIPLHPEHYASLLHALYHHPNHDAQSLLEETRQWARGQDRPKYVPKPDRSPQRRLRIGYLSPFFRFSPDTHFIDPLLAHHDRSQFEIVALSHTPREDEWTDRMRANCDQWIDLRGLNTAGAVERIRRCDIDILVNASSPADECMTILASRIAPIQMQWLVFSSCTTGLQTVDYRISDPYLDPPELGDGCYSETTLRLPETAWCYDPLVAGSEETPGPSGDVIFGSFNRLAKINALVLSAWAEILRAIPSGRLNILAPAGSHRQEMLNHLQKLGVAPTRIEFFERGSRLEYLKHYDRIDISLDTFPFSSHTTAFDALWKGVPLVTLAGGTCVGRAASSALHNLGLKELVGRTPQEYIAAAVGLARDPGRLSELRRTLRGRMRESPLMDAPRFARNIEAAYRQVWKTCCAKGESTP